MWFSFNERRAAQAAAVLLRLSGRRQNYTWLLKVLYLADRESLKRTGAPIAGASFCNMENGPLASDVYDCIKGARSCPFWSEHIHKDGYDVVLVSDPGDDELSDFDLDVLSWLYDQYRAYGFGRMIDVVHELKEWHDPGSTSETLLPEEILRAAGMDEEGIQELQALNSHLNRVDSDLSA